MIAARFNRARGRDALGRLIAADEQLLSVQLMKPTDRRFAAAVERLAALLGDYEHVSMPSAQRLFLMGELRALAPGVALPTLEAERLAAQFVDSGAAHPGNPALEPSGFRDVWKLTARDRRAIALYTPASVAAAASATLAELNRPGSVRFTAVPPGGPGGVEAIAAGPMLPGWQITFTLLNPAGPGEAALQRRRAYFWAGFLAVAVIGLTGLVAGQALRRQARLARLKTDLVAAVSHELKTPLASMRLLVESLMEDGADAARTRDYLELIAGENLRLTRLIDNFLAFSRMDRNLAKFEFAETQPADVVEPALRAMGDRLRPPACHLDVETLPHLPTVLADKDALVTALLNLLDNACKYTPGEKRLSLRAYVENGQVVFAVTDNGIGIAARDRKKIFRRFYQVDRSLARQTGGCGLGLSIVEFIVRAHGGRVTVESRPGQGSTFRILLPAQAPKEAPALSCAS